MSAFFEAVTAYIDAHGLIPPGARVLVGVSGGVDSAVLLDVLLRLREPRRLKLVVGHFNHRVRGQESDDDAAFVHERAQKFGLPCLIGTPYRRLPANEAAWRQARYTWFAQVARELGLTHVAVGHTRSDQFETVLLRMMRGTGLRGLRAMQPIRPLAPRCTVMLVRPLLGACKEEILAYAQERGLPYRTDRTNLDESRQRNLVRHRVVHVLHTVQPDVEIRVARIAERIRIDEEFLSDAAAELARACAVGQGPGWRTFDRAALRRSHRALRTRVLQDAYRTMGQTPYAPDAAAVECAVTEIGDPARTGAMDWPGGVRLRYTERHVTVARVPDPAMLAPVDLPVPGAATWAASGQRVVFALPGAGGAGETAAFSLRAEDVPAGLRLRGWRPGDAWRPSGRAGRESVAETLRAMGVPADRRPATPVLAADDAVWWVVGARPPHGTNRSLAGGGDRLEVRLGTDARAGSL